MRIPFLGLEDFSFIGGSSEPANTALVFKVNGSTQSWKQPLCYSASREGDGSEKLDASAKTETRIEKE